MNKSDWGKQIWYTTTYMWNKKNTNEYNTKQKRTHIHRKENCGYQSGKRRGKGQTGSLGLTDTNYYI